MAKTLEILERWIEMDYHLSFGSGLNVPHFAKEWDVDEKTVRRDLKAFEHLGKKVKCRKPLCAKITIWKYTGVLDPLFVENLPRRQKRRRA